MGTAEEKELAWQEDDDVKTLLVMLVEMGDEEPSYFQARIIDQLDFYDLAHIPRGLGVQVRYIGSDSNGHETGGIMPGIDYSEGTWAFARASEYAPTLLAGLGVPTSEVTKDLIILVTELLKKEPGENRASPESNGPLALSPMIDSLGAADYA